MSKMLIIKRFRNCESIILKQKLAYGAQRGNRNTSFFRNIYFQLDEYYSLKEMVL